VLIEREQLDEAIEELEQAYQYDEKATHYTLVRALLDKAHRLERDGQQDSALSFYERVLNLSPREKVARDRHNMIWIVRGDSALQVGNFTGAIEAYTKADAHENIEQTNKLYQDVQQLLHKAQNAEKDFRESDALAIYEKVLTLSPYEKIARERQRSILLTWGDRALREDNLAAAYVSYSQANAQEQMENVRKLQLRKELELSAIQYERQEHWKKAIEMYQQLIDKDPENNHWQQSLDFAKEKLAVKQQVEERFRKQQVEIKRLESIANQMSQQKDWTEAIKAYRRLHDLDPKNNHWQQALNEATKALKKQRNQELKDKLKLIDLIGGFFVHAIHFTLMLLPIVSVIVIFVFGMLGLYEIVGLYVDYNTMQPYQSITLQIMLAFLVVLFIYALISQRNRALMLAFALVILVMIAVAGTVYFLEQMYQ
jgi:tetratricopeptide (TPR) repeat protein